MSCTAEFGLTIFNPPPIIPHVSPRNLKKIYKGYLISTEMSVVYPNWVLLAAGRRLINDATAKNIRLQSYKSIKRTSQSVIAQARRSPYLAVCVMDGTSWMLPTALLGYAPNGNLWFVRGPRRPCFCQFTNQYKNNWKFFEMFLKKTTRPVQLSFGGVRPTE